MSWFPSTRVRGLRAAPVLRWGILAPGFIAGEFTATLLANTEQRVTAVASRSKERAARFAAIYNIELVAESYEALVVEPTVDIVYIAAPHSEHARLAELAIGAGKHVLVEKPFGTSAAEAERVAASARSAGVFAAEAMWTRYLPQFDVLEQVIERGDLGSIKLATADVGWRMGPTAPARFYDPQLGGGAALDMGVYGYWFAQFAIGRPLEIRTLGSVANSGVDEETVVAIKGADGRLASVTTSMLVANSGLAGVYGTSGSARFLEPFVFPARFVVNASGEQHEWADTSGVTSRAGLAWQAPAIAGFVSEGMTDSPLHSLDDAISVLQTIDQVRQQLEPEVTT